MRILLFFILSLGYFSCQAQNAEKETTFIFTRHAEKVDDGTKDPELSVPGKERAEKLKEVLRDLDISAVYSTDYKRTRETVTPIANEKNLEVQLYDPRDSDFLSSVLKKEEGGTLLISGHSNTVPSMINQLAKTNYPNFSEKEYDNLVLVIIKPENTPKVIWLHIH